MGHEQVPGLGAMVARPWDRKRFPTADEEDHQISVAADVPLEHICACPLLGDGVLQLRASVCVRLDAGPESVEPISEVLKHV